MFQGFVEEVLRLFQGRLRGVLRDFHTCDSKDDQEYFKSASIMFQLFFFVSILLLHGAEGGLVRRLLGH